ATTLLYGLIIYLKVPETRPARPRRPLFDFTIPYRDRIFMAFIAVQFLVAFIFQQGLVALPLDMARRGVAPRAFGTLIALNGVLIVLLQPFVIRWLPAFRRARVLAAAALLVGGGFALNAWWTSKPGYAASITIWTFGEIFFSAVVPTVTA